MLATENKYKLSLAPLQGHTDWTYRNIYDRHFKGVDAYFTPFIRLEKDEVFRSKDLRDVDPDLNEVKQLVPQVIAGEPEEFRKLLDFLSAKGYQDVNLNLGCSFPLIARKGKGAGLLPYPEKIAEMLKVLEEKPEISCSVKMRLGWQYISEGLRVLSVLEKSRITAVILHARLGVQDYKEDVDVESFSRFYEQCSLPMIYNGNVDSVENIRDILSRFPGLEGIMIGRGLLADPLLAESYRYATVVEGEERINRLKAFHKDLFDTYAERLQGPHQLLSKMKAVWEYLMPEADRKYKKQIQKATKLIQYNEAVNKCFWG